MGLTLKQHNIRIVLLPHASEVRSVRRPSECKNALVFKIGQALGISPFQRNAPDVGDAGWCL